MSDKARRPRKKHIVGKVYDVSAITINNLIGELEDFHYAYAAAIKRAEAAEKERDEARLELERIQDDLGVEYHNGKDMIDNPELRKSITVLVTDKIKINPYTPPKLWDFERKDTENKQSWRTVEDYAKLKLKRDQLLSSLKEAVGVLKSLVGFEPFNGLEPRKASEVLSKIESKHGDLF